MADDRQARRLLRDRQVAEYFQVSERTVRTWRSKGALETVRTPGGRPRTADLRHPDSDAESGRMRK